MCGIVGYAGSKNTIDILLDGLFRLEYRGYDSAGVSFVDGQELKVIKCKGRIKDLEKITGNSADVCGAGIGHTRWATHGEPNDINSHPHLSGNKKLSVVHNGIIENYMQIKEFLISKGFVFISDTDTEVISHLIEYYYRKDFLKAVQDAVKDLQGSYALAVMSADDPKAFIAAKKDSPLVIGLGQGENFAASDIPAIITYTKRILVLEDGDIAYVTLDRVDVYDSFKNAVKRPEFTVSWDIDEAEKSGYEHFMIKEIHDEPAASASCISSRFEDDGQIKDLFLLDPKYFIDLDKIWIVACGTAYHAGVAGKYVLERLTGINVEVDIASEFRYRDPLIKQDHLVIIISQSGETIDTLFALREAKKSKAKVISIVNVVGSSIARESDNVFYTYAGPEIAVASTKAYNNQLISLFLISAYIAKIRKTLPDEYYNEFIADLVRIPEYIKTVLEAKDEVQRIASLCFNAKSVFFIGRGLDFALSMEGSLKLKEISYIHSEAYAGGELKHGTIALIEDGTLVVCPVTQRALFDKMIGNIKEVKARGATVLAISTFDDGRLDMTADNVIHLPRIHDMAAPAVAITVMQLFAYYMAVLKGNDVDKPRNLAKSVTVE